ncbi:MAG: hypothetical protein ACSHYA_02405 [Opitutaceae bacterium]
MNRDSTLRVGAWIVSLLVAFGIGQFSSKHETPIVQSQPSENPTNRDAQKDHRSLQAARALFSSSPSEDASLSQTNPVAIFSFLSADSSKAGMVADIARHDIPEARMQALLAVLDTLEADEFQSVIQGLERSGMMDLRAAEFEMIYSAWAQDAPEEAMAYASKQFENVTAKKVILQSWSTHAPEAALAWARANYASSDADTANPWELSIVKGAVATNLDLATEITLAMPYGSRGSEAAASAILGYLNSVDAGQAVQWASQIEDEIFQSISLDLLARKIVQTDPENAFERVSALNYGSGLEHVAEEMAHRRYLESPESAKEWVKGLPVAAIGNATNAVVAQNSSVSLLQTSEWLDQVITDNPDGYYQNAIETMVKSSALEDPQLAAEWIPDLHSDKLQNRYYQAVLSEWVENDPQSAQDWVEYNYESLPEAVLNRFFPNFAPVMASHNQDESTLVPDNE